MFVMSSTHNEYVGEGYYVHIQHCEHRDASGQVCDKYLGVNYPSEFCMEHQPHR
jgi:hypothetical protein